MCLSDQFQRIKDHVNSIYEEKNIIVIIFDIWISLHGVEWRGAF
jgi:hypothetical protein